MSYHIECLQKKVWSFVFIVECNKNIINLNNAAFDIHDLKKNIDLTFHLCFITSHPYHGRMTDDPIRHLLGLVASGLTVQCNEIYRMIHSEEAAS